MMKNAILLMAGAVALTVGAATSRPAVRVYRTENRGEMREVVANRWTPHWVQGTCVVDLDEAMRDFSIDEDRACASRKSGRVRSSSSRRWQFTAHSESWQDEVMERHRLK